MKSKMKNQHHMVTHTVSVNFPDMYSIYMNYENSAYRS